MRWIFDLIFGTKCPMCDRHRRTTERRRQNTAYVEDESNFVTCCLECFVYVEEYWDDMWSDYWGSR